MKSQDPILDNHLRVLEADYKFKAKVVYTLSCIHNYLVSAPSANQVSGLSALFNYQSLLRTLVRLHPDSCILGEVTFFFYRFEACLIGSASTSSQYLDELICLSSLTQVELTDTFIESLSSLLYLLRHEYLRAKEACIKFVTHKLIKHKQKELLAKFMQKYCLITLNECLELSPSLQVDTLLNLVQTCCIQSSPLERKITQEIITKVMRGGWHSENIKYRSVALALRCAVDEQGIVHELFPKFIDIFSRSNPKPLYLEICKTNEKHNYENHFAKILEHFAKESWLSQPDGATNKPEILRPLFDAQPQTLRVFEGVVSKKIDINLFQKYKQIIPIESMELEKNKSTMLDTLKCQPTSSKCFVILSKLAGFMREGEVSKGDQGLLSICLCLLKFYLSNKNQVYLLKIEQAINALVDLDNLLLYIKSECDYLLFLPMVLPSWNNLPPLHLQALSKQVDGYLSSEHKSICEQFYLASKLIKWRYLSGVHKFINYLLRKLDKTRLEYEEICFYLRKTEWTQQDVEWLGENFEEELERILEKIFVKLVDEEFKDAKLIIFELQKYGIFEHWSPTYRWVLNPLDQNSSANPQALVDSLEVFETIVESCRNTPVELVKRFFGIVAKHWLFYNNHHMFTIERIANSLFAQQFSASDLRAIKDYLNSLCPRQLQDFQLSKCSFQLLVKRILLEQSSDLQQSIKEQARSWLASLSTKAQPFKQYEALRETIFCLELLIWLYQYGEDLMEDSTGQCIMRIINRSNQFQITNHSNKELLLESCMEVMKNVPHNCNLLDLKLNQVLSEYSGNLRIMSSALQIILDVKQANVKAVSKFRLQKIIIQVLCSLLASPNEQLNQVHIKFVKELCCNPQSPYHQVAHKNLYLFLQILRGQLLFLTNSYRPSLVHFALTFLANFSPEPHLPNHWVKLLTLKFNQENQIHTLCLRIAPELKEEINDCFTFKIAENSAGKFESKQEEGGKNEDEKMSGIATQSILQQEGSKLDAEAHKVSLKLEMPKDLSQLPKENNVTKQGEWKEKKEEKSNIVSEMEQKNQKEADKIQKRMKSVGEDRMDGNQTQFGSGRKKREGAKEQQSQLATNMKGLIGYIDSLANAQLNEEQRDKLLSTLSEVSQAMSLHLYYCQKAICLGLVTKCLNLSDQALELALGRVIEVFSVISDYREKNVLIFNDRKSIDFFKRYLKKSINTRVELAENKKIIRIIKNSWAACSQFYESGLLSMLFQMCKLFLNLHQILDLLTSSELSYQVVNEIYQRNLFSLMCATLATENSKLREDQKTEICLWTKLMGKVCLNNSIREKMFGLQTHIMAWNKFTVFAERGCLEILAFFYASFCYDFEKVADWAVSQKIPEHFLNHLKKSDSIIPYQFYKFYRYFSQNGVQFATHLLRIKVQEHMLEILPMLSSRVRHEGYKDFYKCLAQLFTSDFYSFFIQAGLVRTLVEKYQEEHASPILECLCKLVDQVKDKRELEQLANQQLFSVSSVFNSKLKDDLSYQYVLQIYISLFRKFKMADSAHVNLELVNKIIRKSIFSINMEGKKKTIEFIVEFSLLQKVYYGNANCMRLFELFFSYDPHDQDFDLLELYLQVEDKYKIAPRASEQARAEQEQKYPLRFKKVVEVPCENLMQSLFLKLEELKNQIEVITASGREKLRKTFGKIVKILKYLSINEENSMRIFDKLGVSLIMCSNSACEFSESLTLLDRLLNWKSVQSRYKVMQDSIAQYLEAIASSIQTKPNVDSELLELYASALRKCLKNNIVSRAKLQGIENSYSKTFGALSIKDLISSQEQAQQRGGLTRPEEEAMKMGAKVRMYKLDGSYSSLTLFFTPDLFELNCASNVGGTVKSKWKMPLQQISQIQEFQSEEQFKGSVFYQAEGIFSKAPQKACCLRLAGRNNNFYICFESVDDLQKWKQYIVVAQSRMKQILQKLS